MKENINDLYSFVPVCLEARITQQTYTCITLHKLVGKVITRLSPQAALQGNVIENDVHEKMLVSTDKDILTSVLGNLIYTMIIYTQNNCIHISAKLIGNISLVHIKTKDTCYNKATIDGIHKIEPLAEKLGGCITISNCEMQGSALAFTFINQ